jgi:hypothetical protein
MATIYSALLSHALVTEATGEFFILALQGVGFGLLDGNFLQLLKIAL